MLLLGTFNAIVTLATFFCVAYVAIVLPLHVAESTLWRAVLYGSEIVIAPIAAPILALVLGIILLPLQFIVNAVLGALFRSGAR